MSGAGDLRPPIDADMPAPRPRADIPGRQNGPRLHHKRDRHGIRLPGLLRFWSEGDISLWNNIDDHGRPRAVILTLHLKSAGGGHQNPHIE